MSRLHALVPLLAVCLAFAGCAKNTGSNGQAAAAKPAATAQPIPASSPLAKVQNGMSDTEVRKIMGEPTSQNAYLTGKQFIPWYFGSDTSRTDYVYKGKGRIVFSRNQYSGQLKVIQVVYDPNL